MSKMLDALKNLSDRTAATPPTQAPAAQVPAPAPAADANAPNADAAADPVLPPLDHARRMRELLVKHLSVPVQTEVFRKPLAESEHRPAPAASGMTVPMASLLKEIGPQAPPDAPEPTWQAPHESSERVEVVCPPPPAPSSVGMVSISSVADLLSSIDQEIDKEQDGPGEEVALSFSAEAEEAGDSGRETGDRGQRSEVKSNAERGMRNADLSATPHSALRTPHDLSPSPESLPAAASALDHLADARPLVTYQPDEEEAVPPPAPLVLPPRSISRAKTRLEQRVLDNLSHPSRSLPYRELADRLAQDLRLLTGRCLLFAGIGPASHADDVLPHLASLLAEDEADVLLVDGDFTRAAMTVGFGALKETGLGELADFVSRGEQLVLPTLLPNVSLLPAGRKALPDTLGVVDQVAQLLAQLEERYSLVLIDGGAHTGPLVPALARLCDATYFVVRLGATDARTATTALKTFRANGARIMGCVATSAAKGAA